MEPAALRLPEVEPDWTPRQREVLDLLVAGRSNREIGEAMGIGLEGAKRHVSEVLSKLGVEHREEAAEYWRHRNGLRMRFMRVARGVSAGLTLRWLAIGAAALVGLAGTGIAMILLLGGGGDDQQPASTLTPEATPPTASATVVPSVTGVSLVDQVIDIVERRDDDAFRALLRTTSMPCTESEFHVNPPCEGQPPETPRDTVYTFQCEARWQPIELFANAEMLRADYALHGVTESGELVHRPAPTAATYWVFFSTSDAAMPEGFGVAIGNGDSGEAGIVAFGNSCGPLSALLQSRVEPDDRWLAGPPASASPAVVPQVLEPGMRGLIGYDSVAYYGITCSGCGGELNLWRASYAGGQLVKDELLPGSTGFPAGSFYTLAGDFDRGEIFVAACIQGYCGQEGEPSADAENVLLHSTDGGVTWEESGSLPSGAILVGLLSDGRLLARSSPAGHEHFFWPSGAAASPPLGAPEAYAFVDASGTMFWRDNASEALFDEGGQEIRFALPPGVVPFIFDRSGSGDLWARWTAPGSDDGIFSRFELRAGLWTAVESWTSPDVGVAAIHLMPGLFSVAAIARYDEEPCVLIGCDPDPRSPAVEAAIVRLDSATIHPIPELSEGLTGNSHPFLRAIAANFPYLTVDTPGDCLNVREAPSASAAVITCAANRVLVRTNGLPEGGFTPVLLLDGREGWVWSEFLLRQQ